MTSHKHLRPLLDLDSFIYGSGFSADGAVVKGFIETIGCDKDKAKELASEEDYLHHALGNLKQAIVTNLEPFNESEALIYLTGHGNYREEVATIAPYKGNRDSSHKPKYYKELRNYATEVWGAQVIDGMEADDAVSMEQWANKDKSTIIVSIDKDLDNTPGWHFRPNRDELYYVTKAEADRNFWMQVATGDATDNIKGLYRIGTKTVWEEWNKHHDLEKFKDWVKRGYEKQYKQEAEYALWENATLVWMLREPWINWDGSNIKEATHGKEESYEEGS